MLFFSSTLSSKVLYFTLLYQKAPSLKYEYFVGLIPDIPKELLLV